MSIIPRDPIKLNVRMVVVVVVVVTYRQYSVDLRDSNLNIHRVRVDSFYSFRRS